MDKRHDGGDVSTGLGLPVSLGDVAPDGYVDMMAREGFDCGSAWNEGVEDEVATVYDRDALSRLIDDKGWKGPIEEHLERWLPLRFATQGRAWRPR